MKDLIGSFVLVMANLAVFAQTPVVKPNVQDDFEKMTFEVELNKDTYWMSEPIFIKFRFSNQTGIPQTTYLPDFLRDSKLKVNFKGKTMVSNPLSYLSPGYRFPSTIQPNWFMASDEVLNPPFVGVYFPEPGEYKLQFILEGSWGLKPIETNMIDVKIVMPTGIDKDAYEFMREHNKFFGLSAWSPSDNEGLDLLETFVSKYGKSVYGETAIMSLGYYLSSKEQLEKAQAEFEKIKSSNNKYYAERARKSLAEIEKRKVELKARLPKK